MMRRLAQLLLVFISGWTFTVIQEAFGQEVPRLEAVTAMRQAAEFYRGEVASHGGYVYHYSVDLSQRWGEGTATADQIWVQPPGTPTVGMAYLRAHEATGDRYYLDAASEAAVAIVHGQLRSGGWTNAIDFNPDSDQTAEYRNGRGRGKNNSSLDDGQTQSALSFLIQCDKALEFRDPRVHEAAMVGLDALLAAQYPNGGFPQVWTRPVTTHPVIAANYPDYDWRTEGRVKEYWNAYTLNDNVTGYVAVTLIDAHRVYSDVRYLESLRKLGDFLLLAQMPEPQPGWCQQYSFQMKPIWARKFEPPAVSGDESQEVIGTLLLISQTLSDAKYLEPVPRAMAWLKRSLLPSGQLARYYELQSNRPLYMNRRGDKYELTYEDSDLPDHYGWKTDNTLNQLDLRYNVVRAGDATTDVASARELELRVNSIITALDDRSRWIDHYDGTRLVGQPKFKLGEPYLSSQTFSNNLTRLAEFVVASGSSK